MNESGPSNMPQDSESAREATRHGNTDGSAIRDADATSANNAEGAAASKRFEQQIDAMSQAISTGNLWTSPRVPTPDASAPRKGTNVLFEFGQEATLRLRNPFSVAVDVSGDILVMDQPGRAEYRVSRFGAAGKFKEILLAAEKGGGIGQLLYPKGLTLDRAGNMYIPEAGNSRIQCFSPDGTSLGTLGELGERPGQFDFPCDVEIDRNGILYVADTGNCRVQQVTARGVPLMLFGVDENGLPDAGKPELDEPLSVAIDGKGYLYVADTNHHRIVKYSPQGERVLAFGCHGETPGAFKSPSDIHVANSGIIYVIDHGSRRVQLFDSNGILVEGFQLNDTDKPTNDGGDVAIDDSGYVYICDRSRSVLIKVELLMASRRLEGELKK